MATDGSKNPENFWAPPPKHTSEKTYEKTAEQISEQTSEHTSEQTLKKKLQNFLPRTEQEKCFDELTNVFWRIQSIFSKKNTKITALTFF